MKKMIILTMLIAFTFKCFSQQIKTEKEVAADEYLTKSKTQKTIGFILLGGGATALVIAATSNIDLNSVGVLAIAGAASALGSIPLFIASSKNKHKAKLLLKQEKVFSPKIQGAKQLAVGVKINF